MSQNIMVRRKHTLTTKKKEKKKDPVFVQSEDKWEPVLRTTCAKDPTAEKVNGGVNPVSAEFTALRLLSNGN